MVDAIIIEWLQQFRHPFLDWFFFIITQLGDMTFFIIVVAVLYWTHRKNDAFKLMIALMISTIITLGLKEIFKRPRPYHLESIEAPNINGVEESGYSFPSGHAQSAGVLSFMSFDLYQKSKHSVFKYITVFFLVFIPFSRLYLAQHYITDVIFGLILGVFITHYTFLILTKIEEKLHIYALGCVPLLLVMAIFFSEHIKVIQAIGGLSGIMIGHFIHLSFFKDVDLNKNQKIFVAFVGIIIIFVLKEGLKIVFPTKIVYDLIRYLIIGLFITIGIPGAIYVKHKHRKKEI